MIFPSLPLIAQQRRLHRPAPHFARIRGDHHGQIQPALPCPYVGNIRHPDLIRILNHQAFSESGLGTGGKVQQAIQAATAAVQGLAGSDISKALAGASAPYIANVIGHSGLDDAGKVLAHAAVNAALAAAQGNNALVGAGGAATAEMVGMIAVNAYGKPVSELSETEKQTVSALATLAAGLAGGLAGGSTADAVAGAQAGKTTVENNALSVQENKSRVQEMSQCQGNKACERTITEKYKQISAAQQKRVVECTGARDCVDKVNEVGRLQTDYANRTNELLEKARVNGGLSPADQSELSILQVTTIQLEADRNAAIHNALMSGDSSEAKQLAINSLAQVAGTSAAGIAGIGKGKGSAMPIPTPTKAANGLVYQSNGKHTPGQVGYNRNAGTEPTNSIRLFGNSVENGKKRYALDEKGNVHQFTNTNDGSWHWSGSTGDASVPLKKSDIPNAVKKEFGLPGKWR